MDIAPLFNSLKIRRWTLPNRIVMPPMVGLRGLTSPEGIAWYADRARGGAGLIIIEATAVNRFGAELTESNLAPLVSAIHAGGALAAIQLFPVTRGAKIVPADLSRQETEAIVCHYRVAAEICAGAGFDGIEPHGAHGYLLNQFFSPAQNARADEFSGSLENRMRMALRIVREIRPICADKMLLLYRHTPVGPGYDVEDSLALARALVREGVDILDLSPSSIESPGDRAAPFRELGALVIAVGGLDAVDRALQVLNEGRADLVAIGRGLIADPEWPIKVREGRPADIIECIKCDEKCHGNLRAGLPIECTQWA